MQPIVCLTRSTCQNGRRHPLPVARLESMEHKSTFSARALLHARLPFWMRKEKKPTHFRITEAEAHYTCPNPGAERCPRYTAWRCGRVHMGTQQESGGGYCIPCCDDSFRNSLGLLVGTGPISGAGCQVILAIFGIVLLWKGNWWPSQPNAAGPPASAIKSEAALAPV